MSVAQGFPARPFTTRSGSNERVVRHLALAESIAWRFVSRTRDADDLRQVAYVGLVEASRRYDPAKGKDFLAFAVPTITGELKRHVRDQGFAVRPPRRIQELRLRAIRSREQLAQELRREPTCEDIAAHLHAPRAQVQEALGSGAWATSLEADAARGKQIIDEASPFERFELLASLGPAVRGLPARERRILYLRFFKEYTQEEIARTVGVTQVHISRLISSILTQLRAVLDGSALETFGEQVAE